MDECNQSSLKFSDDFGRLIPWTTTYFLEVCSRVLLKVTTNGSVRGKQISKIDIFEADIFKQNEEGDQSNLCFLMTLERPLF